MPTEAAVVEVQSPPVQPAAPAGEIHVSESGMVADRGPAPPPPKPGSARDRMFGDLRKKAGEEPPPAATPKPKPETKANAETEEVVTETPETKTETPETTTTPAPDPAKKGKVSPWKLVDEHKAARLKAETELADLRKTMADPVKYKELEEKYAAVEKRAKELDDHIKYVDYTKSQEFQDKYQKPYEDAWHRHMSELNELTVSDGHGGERPLAPTDLLELVNLPLQKAREQAEQQFGNFADDVMAARKEIRGLFESQQKALEDARKLGSERTAQMQKQMQENQESLRKEITTLWTDSNKSAIEDPNYGKFFKPVDGDEEGNTRLKKGYEMADRAFTVNPNDPRLSPDQRAEVVRLHAAIRNRAAGFGRLAYQNSQLEAKIKALTDELNKYKGAEPGAGEQRKTAEPVATSARESVFGALRKFAH